MDSRQVAWWPVWEFYSRLAHQHDIDPLTPLPTPGTLRWVDMADDDAIKLLALLQRGMHAALADDTRQAAVAAASREIASAATWSQLGRGRSDAYVPRQKGDAA